MSIKQDRSFTPTARLLLDAFRAFENELVVILDSKGFTDVTTGNFNILRHLNPEGMRLSELARDAQISKQAIGKMIKDLEHKAYVEIVSDDSDGRAKHVRLTAKGRKLIEIAITAVSTMERDYQALLGKKGYDTFRRSVSQICALHLNREQK